MISSPQGDVDEFEVEFSSNRLYMVWADDNLGIHFSQATADQSYEWAVPISLTESQPEAISPTINVDRNGLLTVAFSLPLNEPRGIYLTQSADGGANWSESRRIFDGATAGWEMVDSPLLAQNDDGQLHLQWVHRALPPADTVKAIASSRSDDSGQNWREMEILVENPGSWHKIVGVGERFVHRFWNIDAGERQILWQQTSPDGGLSWLASEQILSLGRNAAFTITIDPAQRLQLLAINAGRLNNWIWDGSWASYEGLNTDLVGESIGASAANGDTLMVGVSGVPKGEPQSVDDPANRFFSFQRALELPDVLPTPLPTLTPTPVPTGTPEPTSTPWPTSTPLFSTEQQIDPIPSIPGIPTNMETVVLGIIPAGFLVFLLLVLDIWLVRRR